ncbi:retron Ec67 family RNA-directed DNA polymerase/endonuclease [Marinilactibacillus sp. XAAS-LB27]|uniref:retron Ec67 family RNA-directed DNA polymerase/endonuclease n=1 Tax=Marinilactibacillus sp. XAAS-LB27 TaxID=3114538 RepID=UPI002E184CB2|nr:retron Ec67 family RNA-directed DNA polymerase/endonuclease [Marinilactibacillus sp. XAAS-LB27]
MSFFSSIQDRNDFFRLLGISKQQMTYLLYNKEKKGTENSYHTFEIEKKSGGVRVINAPNEELKYIQKKLAALLWTAQKEIWKVNEVKPNISHAFQKEQSIITNAKIHRNKKYVLNVDLEDFFNSFHFGRVKGFFEKNREFKVPEEVALIIAQLTCYQGTLPQGSPSSPIITNLICKILDFRILKLSKKYKLDYTRYADDLTFSTNDKPFYNQRENFLLELEKEIKRAGFSMNEKKTRFQFNTSRQEVTGLVVNKKLNVPKEYYKNTRAMAHSFYKHGQFFVHGEQGSINQLEGRFAFINQLDRYNNSIEYKKDLLSIRKRDNNQYNNLLSLNAREKQYQQFLFCKYFFANEKPAIVTEGKTDIRYLKAALKKFHADYPNLVEKVDSEYIFKITFLRRSKRLRYFFNFSLDGADAMKNLYNFFCDKDNKIYPNYLKYFNSINPSMSKNPIIFIFDNEIPNGKKSKPLKSFINHVGKSTQLNKELIKDKLSLRIENNLYLLTNQLMHYNKENELEDLFDEKTLCHKIDGKIFSKNGDSKMNYGKEIFSKYILDNYNQINLDNFKIILNNLSAIIDDYQNSV